MVVGIDICVSFMVGQGDVGKGNFSTLNAFEYAILSAPSHMVLSFPVLCLVGTVVGISMLNHHNEIVVIRTNGYSLLKICTIAVITACCMSIAVLAVAQWVAPWGKQTAEIRKAIAKSGGEAILSKHGFWLRIANDFVHIDKILYDGELEGVTRYTVENDELTNIIFAKQARYVKNKWHAYGVKDSVISSKGVVSTTQSEVVWDKFLKPEFLRVVTILPEDLSLSGLYNYIIYRKENNLYYEQYELAFWQKILQPLTVMVMVFIAVPFVFAEMRSSAVSKRLVLSILIGVSYFLLEKMFSSVTQVLGLPVLLGALGPALSFMMLALVSMSIKKMVQR